MRQRKRFAGCNAGHTFFHAEVAICKVSRDDQIDLLADATRLALEGEDPDGHHGGCYFAAVRATREAPGISPGGLWPAVHSAGFEPATF
ncbi:hypothetical protein [Streptomyces griseus]|uniref:hypothetical protein n=1 Tax=Streptomyces griseus TaxID=1911 RepID=UPI00373AF462